MTNQYAPTFPPTPGQQQQQPRLIELVNELVGAQTVAKMISDAISNLTEEQKKQITDAIFKNALAFIEEKDQWGHSRVSSLLTDFLNNLLRQRMAADEELASRMAKEAFAKLEASWPAAVDAATKRWIAQALEAVRRKFDDVARGF